MKGNGKLENGLSRLEAALQRLEVAAHERAASKANDSSGADAELAQLRQKHDRLTAETELAIQELDRLTATAGAR